MVEGKTVQLEKDVSETDGFGRLLRYVYVDGLMVNAVLVKEGLAEASNLPPDTKNAAMFLVHQTNAQLGGRGMWETSVPTISSEGEECDPAYPKGCVPPPPPEPRTR